MGNLKNIQDYINLESIKNIHFIGANGVSISALMRLCCSLGKCVTGSDIVKGNEVVSLEEMGIKIFIGHSSCNIGENVELVVYSGAISKRNIELIEAKKRNIKTIERGDFLGEVAKLYENVIAVAGSHGKTTTSAMIAHIFRKSGQNPTMHLGGESVDMGNILIGGRKYFITEACEYRNSMASLRPDVSVITNIDNDHLDFYKTKNNLVKAFVNFANNTKTCVFVSSGRSFRQRKRCAEIVSVGRSKNQNIYVDNIQKIKNGYKFDIVINDSKIKNIKLNLLGKHNIKNALFAISVAYRYGINIKKIKKALATFKGVKRRYENKGKYLNIPVISDYAHHPTEIKNSIDGLKDKYKNILVVFQPHTYSRTRILLKDFRTAFSGAKALIIYKTYPARENYDKRGDEKTLCENINLKNKSLVNDYEDLWGEINQKIKNFCIDAVVFMGAGDLPETITI